MSKSEVVQDVKKNRGIIKAIGSVLFAIIASSHHWVHTLLIALGLTTLSSGLLSLSPSTKIIFLLVSLVISAWFIRVAKRKWSYDRPAAWVYLISSRLFWLLHPCRNRYQPSYHHLSSSSRRNNRKISTDINVLWV